MKVAPYESSSLVVLAKYLFETVVLFSINYLFAQNSIFIYSIYACVYTLGILAKCLVFSIFMCSFERVTAVLN